MPCNLFFFLKKKSDLKQSALREKTYCVIPHENMEGQKKGGEGDIREMNTKKTYKIE